MNEVINLLSEFTTIIQWIADTLYNVLVNITTYIGQLMQVISLLPEFVKYSAVASIALTFAYMLLKEII